MRPKGSRVMAMSSRGPLYDAPPPRRSGAGHSYDAAVVPLAGAVKLPFPGAHDDERGPAAGRGVLLRSRVDGQGCQVGITVCKGSSLMGRP
jgi:hypothetical protein